MGKNKNDDKSLRTKTKFIWKNFKIDHKTTKEQTVFGLIKFIYF